MMEPHNHFKIYLLHLLLTTVACDWQADLNPLSVVNDEGKIPGCNLFLLVFFVHRKCII